MRYEHRGRSGRMRAVGPGPTNARPRTKGGRSNKRAVPQKPLVAPAIRSVPFPDMTLNNSPERERNPFLEAVGRVTLAGGELDHSLRHLLGTIALEPTLIMYANATKTAELLTICRLALKASTLGAEHVTEIEACLNRADTFRNRRNTIVHALYMPAESGAGIDAMSPAKKTLGYNTSPISIEEMEALAEEVTVLRDDMFTAGWNATAGKMPGMQPIPPRKPGQRVNGVLPKT